MYVQEIGCKIDEIVEKRKKKLPDITEKIETLEQLRQQVSMVKAIKTEMISEDGEILEGGRFTQLLRRNPEIVWTLKDLQFDNIEASIGQTRKALQDYYERCSRERINISVVGMARIGKSELLKSISGLSNQVIPAFDSSDCTGAPSIINNVPDVPLTARLTFKTPDAMRQMAQTYLDRMIPDLKDRPILRSMEMIRTLSLKSVEKAIPMGNPNTILLPYLQKMVEHYDEWAPLAGSAPFVLSDERQIMTYVAQNNGVEKGKPDREEFFRYLAVDTCVIDCAFPESGMGKISLIDTVGLGDHTIGIVDNMMQTIKSQSDAVIFVHNPRDGSGSGFPQPVAAVYEGIYAACKDKKLDEWLYYLINHVSHATKKLAVNTEFCKTALETLQSSRYCGAKHAKIIDATDVDSVRYEFLVPLLEGIALNLDDIDEIYRVPAEQELQHLRAVYNGFCLQVRKALQKDLNRDQNVVSLMLSLSEKTTEQLLASMYQLTMKWRQEKDHPCVKIDRAARRIFGCLKNLHDSDSYLPSEASLRDALRAGKTVSELYIQSANSIRNKVLNGFLGMEQEVGSIIMEMKGDVAKVLYEDCGLKKICELSKDEQLDSEWLKNFSEMVLGEGEKYSSIKLAIDTLAAFDFSVKSFLIYEVRDCLDNLDPHVNMPTLVVTNDNERDARNLLYQIYPICVRIAKDLEKKMSDVLCRPNRAVAAALMDFLDRVYYGDKVRKEWNDLLLANAGLLWADQLREQQRTSALCDEWMDVLEKLQTFNQASFYQM